ncbi:hypothetical protein BgiBS90_006653 [Biomphalaria glabrata]|nr:hypothetical protein BgiBS90_006653 [Biomphalaria glabrata]
MLDLPRLARHFDVSTFVPVHFNQRRIALGQREGTLAYSWVHNNAQGRHKGNKYDSYVFIVSGLLFALPLKNDNPLAFTWVSKPDNRTDGLSWNDECLLLAVFK